MSIRTLAMLVLLGALAILGHGAATGLRAQESAAPEIQKAAATVTLEAKLATPVLLAGKKQNAYLQVRIIGLDQRPESKRSPLNIACVIDKSGSMSGQKIADARAAAELLVENLQPNDIFSLITYDTEARVVIPATKVTDRQGLLQYIRDIQAAGNTALFDGVSKGWSETKKFCSRESLNRIILISDGLANVGPETPGDLANLGGAIGAAGITVSTIGVGLDYNEDLMTGLAQASGGNHAFVENSNDLPRIFEYELGELTSIIAKDVTIHVTCEEDIRPVRILGRDAEIQGRQVTVPCSQLAAKQIKFVILEVEIPAGMAASTRRIATARVAYRDVAAEKAMACETPAGAEFTADDSLIDRHADREAMIAVARMLANEANKAALALRDQGRIDAARNCLNTNADYLDQQSRRWQCEELRQLAEIYRSQSCQLDDDNWKKCRKSMRNVQHVESNQQEYNSEVQQQK